MIIFAYQGDGFVLTGLPFFVFLEKKTRFGGVKKGVEWLAKRGASEKDGFIS